MTTSEDEARELFAKPIRAPRKRSPKRRSTSALGSDAHSTSKRPQQQISSDSDCPRLATPPVTVRKPRQKITLDSSDEASEADESARAKMKRELFGDIGLNGTGGAGGDGVKKGALGKGWRDASSEQEGKSVATTSKLHALPRPLGRPGVQESAAKKVTNSKSATKVQQASLSPPPAAQPIKAQSFWGPAPATVVKPPPKIPFEQTKRLASLSTIGKKLERARNEEEDEIDMLDEVEELKDVVGGDGNYVTYEAGIKQKKAASLRSFFFVHRSLTAAERYPRPELLKEKRQSKQAVTPAPKPAGLFAASTSDERCALCNRLVRSLPAPLPHDLTATMQFPASILAAHSEDCFTRQAQAASKSRSPPPLPAPPLAASKFRFAGAGAKAALPPPPRPPPIAPIPPPKAKDKGKAKEILIIDDDEDEEQRGVPAKAAPSRKRVVEEEEDYFQDDDFPAWEEFDEPAPRPPAAVVPPAKKRLDKGKGRAVAPPSKSRPIVIDLDDNEIEIDEHDDAPLANSHQVNSRRIPGPPIDSSPPKASIYLSTLPKALKVGCESLVLFLDAQG